MAIPVWLEAKKYINTRYLRFAKGYPFRTIGYRHMLAPLCMVGAFFSGFFFGRIGNGVRKNA